MLKILSLEINYSPRLFFSSKIIQFVNNRLDKKHQMSRSMKRKRALNNCFFPYFIVPAFFLLPHRKAFLEPHSLLLLDQLTEEMEANTSGRPEARKCRLIVGLLITGLGLPRYSVISLIDFLAAYSFTFISVSPL